MLSEHTQHAVLPATSAPPLLKIPRPRGAHHKMHEIAVAADAATAAAVDAAAAADRLVSGNGGVHRSSWSKGR